MTSDMSEKRLTEGRRCFSGNPITLLVTNCDLDDPPPEDGRHHPKSIVL